MKKTGRDAESARYADLAARLLVRREREAGGAAPGDRLRAVEALAAALRLRARRRARRWWWAAAAGLLLAAGLGGLLLRRPGAITARLASGQAVRAGEPVLAAGEAVTMELSTGSQLRLDPGGRLDLVALGGEQRFFLRSGRLFARVAPLGSGQRFVVVTPDVEVEVRGTSFEVAVVPARPACSGIASDVRVLEGRVTVRRGGGRWQLGSGMAWPTHCPPAPPAQAAGPVPAGRSAARAAAARGGSQGAAGTRAGGRMPGSSLAEQNDLFAAAMAAQRGGDVGRAARLLDDLITRYPSGPLAASARDQRAKLTGAGPGADAEP